jgi:sugar-specific transcriptional regulator TrmB/DNA-binding CsgD family transcriptional regulator
MLDVLGLHSHEELVYRHLVGRPAGTAADLAAALGFDRAEMAAVLTALEDKGLVARATSGQERYVASPPAVALGALLVQRQEELHRAQVAMAELVTVYRSAGSRRDVADVVDVVRGVEAIGQRFAQLQRTARHQVQTLVSADVAVVSAEANQEVERAALARGVRYQVVLERGAFERPGFYGAAEEALASGVELRVAIAVPLRLLVVDRELALIPLVSTDADEPVRDALLVHRSGLLDGLLALFDAVWQGSPQLVATAEGIAAADADALDPIDRKLLSLLLAGLTDQSIGLQLGLSLRTVQRRVRQMMDRAGVETRLQLGHHAARRGWA